MNLAIGGRVCDERGMILDNYHKTLYGMLVEFEFNLYPATPNYPIPKQALVFTCLQYKSFENTVGKGEIARNEQFLLFPQCFLPIWRTFCHFHEI